MQKWRISQRTIFENNEFYVYANIIKKKKKQYASLRIASTHKTTKPTNKG